VSKFTLFGAPVRRALFHLVPCIFAAAVLTVVLFRSGNLHPIPGTWLLLYGCALLCASLVTSRLIAILGGLFIVLALVAFCARRRASDGDSRNRVRRVAHSLWRSDAP